MLFFQVCTRIIGVLVAIFSAMEGTTGTLSPQGSVSICTGQPRTFTCSISNSSPLSRLVWRLDFQDDISMPTITEQFTSVDHEGQVFQEDRNGLILQFSLISNTNQSLESVMNMTVPDNNTIMINNVTVSCGPAGEEPYQHVLLSVITGPPIMENNNMGMNVTRTQSVTTMQQESGMNQSLVTIHWNAVELATHYIINISPAVQSGSTFNTTDNSYQLSVLINQEYNITVMACNCAGNVTSTITRLNLTDDYCTISDLNPGVSSNGSDAVLIEQGSYVSFICEVETNKDKLVAECMSDGKLHPDPVSLNCTDSRVDSTTMNDAMLLSIILSISAAVFIIPGIVISLVVMIIRAHKRFSHKTQVVSDANTYTHAPVLNEDTNDNQGIGIYSLLQPEEKLNITGGPLSTPDGSGYDQDLEPTYADIRCTTPFSINNNISLQLDDDRVLYAEIKPQESHVDYGNTVSFTESNDDVPPPVPPKLANLDEEMLA